MEAQRGWVACPGAQSCMETWTGLSPCPCFPCQSVLGPSPRTPAGLAPRFILQDALPWQAPRDYPDQIAAAAQAGAVRDTFSFHRRCQAWCWARSLCLTRAD